jgi:hypothetical protein
MNQVMTHSAAELREKVFRSLRAQGFRVRNGSVLPPAELSKDRIRELHETAVEHRIERARNGLFRMEKDLLRHIASGREVDPMRMSPRLVEVPPESEEELLFRYASLHWSIPVSSGYGKRLRFLVVDDGKKVELVDQPEVDRDAIRVCGPFEVMSLGRYSVEDWKGYVVREAPATYGEPAKLENYIETICRLYRKDAAIQGASGLVHAVAENEREKIAISVGPLSGRVTAKQIHDAVQDALASGILEVHVLGWAFEANVGEVKSALEKRGKVKVELIMIRPDTLAEGLKVTQPEMLFSPLALPDIEVAVAKNGKEKQVRVTLKGVALFDRKTRTTAYKAAESGYISAWYLDEDYDGDCFVDCQMFFDFKKTPNIKAALKAEVEPEEFKLKLTSEPFPVRGYKRIAVKVVDVYGNESTVVREVS